MDLIVAVSSNWGIGNKNDLLFSIAEDMKFFREKTKGATVIMGRATLESLPGGLPLKGRRNIVMSTNRLLKVPGAEVLPDEKSVLEAVSADENVFVIGGEAIYRMFLKHCSRAFVTKVDATPVADRFFPDLDRLPEWELASPGDLQTSGGLSYRFTEYVRK